MLDDCLDYVRISAIHLDELLVDHLGKSDMTDPGYFRQTMPWMWTLSIPWLYWGCLIQFSLLSWLMVAQGNHAVRPLTSCLTQFQKLLCNDQF